MTKALRTAICLLVSIPLFSVLGPTAKAALHPLELPSVPADSPSFSAADNRLQLSLALGLRTVLPARAENDTPTAPKLNLVPPTILTGNPNLLVGNDAFHVISRERYHSWNIRPADDMRDEWDFFRRATTGPDNLERLSQLFDVDEKERPWSTTTTVHLMAPTNSWLVPFATIAHEVDVNEDLSRFGIGAGAMILFNKNVNFGAEIIRFSGDRSSTNDAFSSETRFWTRLQVEF
jgi:hypothetical protein